MKTRRPFLWALLGAALLHGGLWWLIKAPALEGAVIAQRDAETLIELWDEGDDPHATNDDTVDDATTSDDTADRVTPAREAERDVALLDGLVGATAEPHLGTGSDRLQASGSGLREGTRLGAADTAVTGSDDSRLGAADTAVTDTGDSRLGAAEGVETHSAVPRQTDTQNPSPGRDGTPEISLAQAGYGAPSPWVLPKQAPSKATAEDRLERNLAEGAMRHDYQRSMGIEGPVVAAINRAAWGHVPPWSKAHLSVLVDGNGQVVAIDVEETNSDMARYRELAAAALAALRSVKLRVPEGRQVVLTFQVESKVLLPSGRKPQRGVSILGQQLGEDDGKHEPMVKILSPEFGVDKTKMPNPANPDEDIELPTLKMGLHLLDMNPDLVDWGAVTRQVVHTKLVGQRVVQ